MFTGITSLPHFYRSPFRYYLNTMTPNPSGICQCGCGLPTKIVKRNRPWRGAHYVAGLPALFCKGHRPKRSASERFQEKIQKTDGCWLWTGGVFQVSGYGQFNPDTGPGHVPVAAHRFSWELFCGPIPDGLDVLHRCDVRRCVRPDHLFLGTHQANMDDKVAKDRQVKGEAVNTARLTAADIPVIRRRFAAGESSRALARQYGVSKTSILRLARRRSWKHVP